MSTISIKNLASAIYESSVNKEGDELDIILKDSTKLIAHNNLLGKSEQILTAIENITNKEQGRICVKVKSKIKITDKMGEEIVDFIKKRYKAKEVILEFIEDHTLLGGIKIEIGDEIIDTTLRYKLNQLQNYLTTN